MNINENLIMKSDDRSWAWASDKIATNLNWSGGFVKIEPNQTYTFSKYGGNRFFNLLFKVEPKLGDGFDTARPIVNRNSEIDTITFTTKEDENYLFFYGSNTPVKVLYKLEKGSEATLYIPNKSDLKDYSLYPDKVGGGIWEEIRPI